MGISSGQAYGSAGYTYGTGTTYFVSESSRSGQAVAIYVSEARSSVPASNNSDVVSKSQSIQECIDVCVKNTSRSPEVCFDACVD